VSGETPEQWERWSAEDKKRWSAEDKKRWAEQLLNMAPGTDHPMIDRLISVMEREGEREVHRIVFGLARRP